MPQYMIQFAYARDAWTTLARQPIDRSEVVGAFAESLGGRLLSLHYTMGDFDGVAIVEAADDVTAMAMALRTVAGGHVRTTRTTRLYTPQEMVQSLKKAGEGNYEGPRRQLDAEAATFMRR